MSSIPSRRRAKAAGDEQKIAEDQVNRFKGILVFGALTVAVMGGAAQAQTPEEFYKGKTMRMLIPAAVGDSYDTEGRLIIKHLSRFIPGNPTIVVENMPGASGRNVASYMYNVAPKDGSVIALVQQSIPLAQATRETGINFDSTKFNWLGTPSAPISVLAVWHTAGVKTFEEARQKDLTIGSTSTAGNNYVYPKLMKELLGAKFKIITGYPGGAPIDLAMERGEVQGRGSNPWNNYKLAHASWVSEGKLIALVQMSRNKHPELQNVPRLLDLTTNDDERKIFELLSVGADIGRPMLTTPGVPADRVKALREAFAKTMADPVFLAEARQRDVEVDPTFGEELQGLVEKMLQTDPKTIDLMAATLAKP
jgi:tripartite-type tricarboxylate transporter receptor subunit TctC